MLNGLFPLIFSQLWVQDDVIEISKWDHESSSNKTVVHFLSQTLLKSTYVQTLRKVNRLKQSIVPWVPAVPVCPCVQRSIQRQFWLCSMSHKHSITSQQAECSIKSHKPPYYIHLTVIWRQREALPPVVKSSITQKLTAFCFCFVIKPHAFFCCCF